MAKKNYSKMSTENVKKEDIKESLDPIAEAVEASEPEVSIQEETYVEPKHYEGIVKDCVKLNVREKADAKSKVLGTIPVGAIVTIFPDESTDEWFRVVTNNPFDGYCMKEFIKVKE